MLRTMKTRVARGRYGKDEGFTLIELMVVVLIIAILLAIAIPTFLGAQNRAKDRAAQSSLRNTLAAAKAMYTDTQDFSTANAANLTTAEPNLDFVTGANSTGPNQVSVYNAGNVFIISALSKTDTCFTIKEDLTNGAVVGTKYAKVAGTACKAEATTAAALDNW